MSDIDRRTELLQQVTAWAVDNGLHGLSLRPLADALGTSARMLLYHFGSKQQLTTAILEQIAMEWMGALERQLEGEESLDKSLERFWKSTLRDPSNRAVHALALEAWALGISTGDPAYRPFLELVATGWIQLIEQSLRQYSGHTGRGRKSSARRRATLMVAAIEGLLLHQMTDPELPVDEAFTELLSWLRMIIQSG